MGTFLCLDVTQLDLCIQNIKWNQFSSIGTDYQIDKYLNVAWNYQSIWELIQPSLIKQIIDPIHHHK